MATRITLGVLILMLVSYSANGEATLEEKMKMSTLELIEDAGLNGEEFEVETEDGYILKVQKITYGEDDLANPQKKMAVYLQHGFACDSSTWIINGNKSLAYILAEAGYDVFMGNLRGNMNSRHKSFAKWDPRFYDFTWDDHVYKDLPAQWNFVLNKAGQEKIFNAGLSLGVWSTLANFASSDEFQDKFLAFFATGPVTWLTYNTKEDWRLIGQALPELNLAEPLLLLPYKNTYSDNVNCEPNCTDTEKLYNLHCNSGSSFKAGLHGLQLTKSNEWSHFDYTARNLLVYGPFHFSPPAYDPKKIKVPVYLYSAPNDDTANPMDVARLHANLPNVRDHLVVPDDILIHHDFITGRQIHEQVYYPILHEMNKIRDEITNRK